LLDYSPAIAGRVDYLLVSDSITTIDPLDSELTRSLPAAVAGHARAAADRTVTGVAGLSQVSAGNGVVGIATGSGGSYGVWGISDTGNGVVGRSFDGYALYGEGRGRLGLAPHTYAGPPTGTDATYTASDLVRDSQGTLWTCVISGAPGVWREVAGPTSAGAFHAITPSRVFDSRSAEPAPGLVVSGAPRTVSVADGRDPADGSVVAPAVVPEGATAIACNVTVAETVGNGYLLVNPGTSAEVGASTINWLAGQVLANGIIVGIDEARRVTLVAGGGGAAHVILDVSGYFR
jgi:hypothetical protein